MSEKQRKIKNEMILSDAHTEKSGQKKCFCHSENDIEKFFLYHTTEIVEQSIVCNIT